jgi:hypothetical protein
MSSPFCIHFIHFVSGANAALMSHMITAYSFYFRFVYVYCCPFFSGTFCTLDICISRLEDVGTVDVRGTVERIRSQRAYSIQVPDQYVFCHLALIEYALGKQLIPHVDLTDFDNLDEDESD